MDKLSSTDMDSHTYDETSFDDESDLNTADLSHISGLSKILRVDDSIADRVRCLLASDTEDGDREKPELLSSAKELPSSDELAERISKLLQDGDSSHNADDPHGSNDDNVQNMTNLKPKDDLPPAASDEKNNSSSDGTVKVDTELSSTTIPTAANGRRSGDGADNEPTTITAESSDDIMNVSDATEYSDLPKVVDNPIKRLSTGAKGSSQPNSCPVSNDPIKTSRFVGIIEKVESRMLPDCIIGTSDTKDVTEAGSQTIQTKEKIPLQPSADMCQVNVPGCADLTEDKLKKDQPVVQSSMNTTAKRDVMGTTSNVSHSLNAPNTGTESCVADENLSQKIKKTISSSTLDSDSLKGPHTSSAQSIASSIDSLGLKVKCLLKGKESNNVCDANTSSVSNYSEEIYNFEKTNLWRYTRQFLPGAISQPSTIQPRAKFSDASSPIVGKDTTDSSASSTPITYRLAREIVTPVNMKPYLEKDSLHPSHSKNSSEVHRYPDRDATSCSTLDDLVRSNGVRVSTSSFNRGTIPEYCPQPSTYFSASNNSDDITPASSSYRSLYPQYSDTPYSFITPRRVAWEPSSTHKKNEPLERSAYFHPDRFSDLKNNPTPAHRTSAAPYRRLALGMTESAMRQSSTQEDKTTCTNERSVQSSHNDMPTKSVTLPSSKSIAHNSDDVTYSSSRMRPSPKSVRFEKTTSSKLKGHSNDVKATSLPEYSFTTPRTSNRPRRNITPKVDRENPRPTKSLPTYDQMVMEEECLKSLNEKAQDDAMLIRPEVSSVSVKKSPAKDNIVRSSTPTGISEANQSNMGFSLETGTFSALKPEICLEESVCEDDIARFTAVETDDNARLSREIVDSDVRVRSAISPQRDAAVISCNDPTNLAAKYHEAPNVCPTDTQTADLDPALMVTEPAPLPYVRLGRNRTISPFRKGHAHTPPRHSISTEKVQNLLMKEAVPRTGSASVDFSHRLPAVDYSSSSDDDLLNLLETVASKVPVMQKLLKKLYDKSIEQKNTQDPSKIPVMKTDREADTPIMTDQSVQTMGSPSKISNPALGKGSVVIDSVTESSCQTSLLKPKKRILVAHKSTSPMEDFYGDEGMVQHAFNGDKSNKENKMEPKQPCAFFVDMTPKKSGKLDNAITDIGEKQSVAWYEPYKYVPFWKQEQTQRKTLGFVDANVQDAFLNNKRDFVLRSWERQEDIAHRAQERRLRELEQNIHDQIKALHKEKTYKITTSARPASTVPKKKKERTFGWKEMKMASKQKYDALPEVVAKKQEAERLKYYEANRKRAEMYKRRITHMIVQKQREKLSSEAR